ncbi:MAG: outer membrane protein [Candidatus Rokuibacteriota bacterium]
MTCGLILGAASPVHAELYLAVFGGVAFSESKVTETRLDVTNPQLGTLISLDGKLDAIEFDDSLLVGAKFGYFFTRPFLGGHFGTELEFYYTQPEVSSQTVTFSGTMQGVPTTTQLSASASFDVFTVALNLLYRLPLFTSEAYPNGRLQPYIGVGAGAFIATMETRTTPLDSNKQIEDTDVQPGVQALGGLKFFLTRNVAVFAEYRFAQTDEFTFDFKAQGTLGGLPVTETARDRSDLTQHQAAFGIAVHW